jgi:hypothetical protein
MASARILVRMAPGLSSTARTLVFSISSAQVRTMASIAALLAP